MICTGSYDEFMTHKDGISISGDRGRRKNYQGDAYIKLAPKYSWWKEWEELSKYMDFHDSVVFYMEKYYETVLANLEPLEVFNDLDGKILLCYEESEYFCHRHIVAAWLELCLGVTVPEVKNLGDKLLKVHRPAYVKELLPIIIKNYNSRNKILSKANENITPINH